MKADVGGIVCGRMRRRIAKPRLDDRGALALLAAALEEAVKRGKLRSTLESLVPPRYRADLAQRFRVAQLLIAGFSYRGIEDATSTSARTIAAVDRWLKQENPSYRRLSPLRHARRYRRDAGSDRPPPIFPFNYRGQVLALFGLDPRQR